MIGPDQDWPLDQHTVTGQELDLRFLVHAGQFVFELQFSVLHTTAVEEGADGLAAFGNPVGQLLGPGPVFFNIAELIGDLMLVKETPCFTAGPSFGITDK